MWLVENGLLILIFGMESRQNKVIQVTDAENKFVLFHEKDFGKIIQVRYKWKESWNESFS